MSLYDALAQLLAAACQLAQSLHQLQQTAYTRWAFAIRQQDGPINVFGTSANTALPTWIYWPHEGSQSLLPSTPVS